MGTDHTKESSAVSPTEYMSPLGANVLGRLEERLLGPETSWWTHRPPLWLRLVAEVPEVLYLNFLARRSAAEALAPGLFTPLELPSDPELTPFSVLLFRLHRGRPTTARWLGGLPSPTLVMSNWRFYGTIREPGSDPRPGVLFVRSVTPSLALAIFGRRLARCFPLHRARDMSLLVGPGNGIAGNVGNRTGSGGNGGNGTGSGGNHRSGAHVSTVACIDPGQGSAPGLDFEAVRETDPSVPAALNDALDLDGSYERYCERVMDQHLSLTLWPHEYVIQDMHLDLKRAELVPLRCTRCELPGLTEIAAPPSHPVDCFAARGLRVFLDEIRAVRRPA